MPKRKAYIFEQQMTIDKPLADVFVFFSRAENLQLLTPSWLKFRILTPLPIKMEAGTIIDYSLSLFGIPFKWKTEISVWQPPHRFIDSQIKGPYKKWIHQHRFEPFENKTIMYDRVEYDFFGFFLTGFINKIFVSKNIRKI